MEGDYAASGGCLSSLLRLVEAAMRGGGLKQRAFKQQEEGEMRVNHVLVNEIRTGLSASRSPAPPELRSPGPVARLMGLELMISEPISPSLSCYTPRTRSLFADFLLNDPKRHSFDAVLPLKGSSSGYHQQRMSLHVPREKDSRRLDTEVSHRRRRAATPPPPADQSTSPMGVHVRRKVSERVGRRNVLHDITNANSRTPTSCDCQEIRRATKVRNLQQSTLKKSRKGSDCHTYKKVKKEPFFESAARRKATPENSKSKVEETPIAHSRSPVKAKRVAATRLPPRETSHMRQHLHLEEASILPGDNCATTTTEYKRYVRRILKRAGFMNKGIPTTPFATAKLLDISHPLDASIFFYLELFHPIAGGDLRHRCNRKLIFQAVNEILADSLKHQRNHNDSDIFDQIWDEIDKFPAADCKFPGDIDGLIESDFNAEKPPPFSHAYLEEEANTLIPEIQNQILESLLLETMAAVMAAAVR